MKNGWEIKMLKEVGSAQTGTTPKTADKKNYGEYIPFIKPADIDIDGNGKIKYDNEGLSEQGVKNGRTVTSGSILMVCIGATIGKVGFSTQEVSFNQQINTLTLNKGYYPKYFYYALTTRSFFDQVMNNASQATLPIINKGKWEKLKVGFPKSIDEQKRIVALLDAVFLAIDKAKANAAKNLQNAKDLFESYLQNIFSNSEEEWEKCTIGDLVEKEILSKPLDGNHGEIHPTKEDFVRAGVPFIMASDLKDGIVDLENCKFILNKQAESLRKGFAIDGDILLSHKGTIGRAAILTTNYDYITLTPQVTYYRIDDKKTLFNEFLYYYFLSPIFQKKIIEAAEGGATRAYIGITRQLTLPISYPKSVVRQKQLVDHLKALSSETKKLKVIYQQKQNDLDELKKSILQKAFNGELKTAESEVEA